MFLIYPKSFIYALIYTYKTGLGDFQTDDYTNGPNNDLVYFLFMLCSFSITLVMLNLLIAIMGETYGRVAAVSEETKLREIASMISDSEFILKREEVFKDSKYVVICSLE
jgi:hypothetical protein